MNKKFFANLGKYSTLIIGVLAVIIPIIVIVFASFKTTAEYNSTTSLSLPQNWFNFENYIRAFVDGNMLRGFINTTIILVISLIGAIWTGTSVAYVLSRFDFKFKSAIKNLFSLAVLIPGITTQVATFQIINSLGLFNSRGAAIVLYMGTDIIAVYIFLQFLDSISLELDEAALLEGASYFKIYTSIILPLLKPAIATVVIIKGVGIYNDFYTPYLYMPSEKLATISTTLYRFQGPYGSKWEIICAGIVIVLVPTLIAFVTLQKYIYSGITAGSTK